MSDNKLTKDEIRKEIKRETKAYRRKRRWSTFAVILVLIAIILLFIFADEKGLLGSGTSLGLGDKATDVVNQAASTIDRINEKMTNNSKDSKEEVVNVDQVQNKLNNEKAEEVLNDNSTIVVAGTDIVYKGNTYNDVSSLKEELLKEEFNSEDILTLKDDKAIKATYEDVKDILDNMEQVQYIEE